MELLPPTDFFESFDFNFMTAEFLQTREHDYDATNNDRDQKQLDWPNEEDNGEQPKITIMEVVDDNDDDIHESKNVE